jgi:tetratricopeptide (TPR) repeat protein
MIVRNESANLPRCLASVGDDVDELIVVDTGSSDDTPSVAADLDADEELAPASRLRVRQTAAATDAAGILVNQRSRNADGDLTEFRDSWQVRLFRNQSGFRYEGVVHEQIIYAITRAGNRVAPSDLEVIHHGFLQGGVQSDSLRVQRNARLLERAVAGQPESAYLCAHLGLVYFNAGRTDDALACLRRCVRELDSRSLRPDLLHQVFITLGQIGLARKDFALAVACSQASLDMSQAGPDVSADSFDALMALKAAAYAHMGAGWSQIGAAREDLLEAGRDEGSASGRVMAHLRAIQQELDLARGYFGRMLDSPALTTGARAQVEVGLRRLDGMLGADLAPGAQSRKPQPAA